MAKEPILELSTKGGETKHRGLTLGQVEEAQRLLDAGKTPAEEIDKRYPGWQAAAAELHASLGGLAKAARAASDAPGQTLARALKDLDASRSLMGDALRQTASLADLSRGLGTHPGVRSAERPLLNLRDPDAATREVADEVRDLATLVATMAESAEVNARVATASLDQTTALLMAVRELEETTRRGIAAGETRDAAAVRRDRALLGLTWAIVALTAVLAVAEGPHAWERLEPLRAALAGWLSGVAPRMP